MLYEQLLFFNILISPLHVILNSDKYFSNMDSYIEFVIFSSNKRSVHFPFEKKCFQLKELH